MEGEYFYVGNLEVRVWFDYFNGWWCFGIFDPEGEALGGGSGYTNRGEAGDEGECQAREDWFPIAKE